MFQPAEEGGAGAKRMIEEGILEKEPKPQNAFGLHLWPTIKSGAIACKSGTLLSACDRFSITVEGTGGHAAMPTSYYRSNSYIISYCFEPTKVLYHVMYHH